MKRILNIHTKLLAALLVLFALSACEDDSEIFTVMESSPMQLNDLDISNIELDANNTTNPAATFIWTAADYGQPAAENYSLEVSSDEGFNNAVSVASTTGTTSVTLTVGELNSAADNAGLNPFEWGTLYARVVSSLGSQNGLPVNSNTITFSVYPYYNYPYTDLYFVGPACASGWANNNNNPALFRDGEDDKVFTYTGYFNADQLKMLEMRGAWAPQYGADSGKLAYRPTEDDPDPAPIEDITSSGYYKFTCNISSLEYSLEPVDGSAPALNSLAITGSALEADTNLQQYGIDGIFDEHIWYVSSVHLVPGELQFLANGSESWGGNTSFSGVATAGGNAITVIVEDDYEVWFNDLTGDYIMIPLNL